MLCLSVGKWNLNWITKSIPLADDSEHCVQLLVPEAHRKQEKKLMICVHHFVLIEIL